MGPEPAKSNWKDRLHEIIYEADTPEGKAFDIVLLFVILLSIALIMLESMQSFRQNFPTLIYFTEWFITIAFTIEYILRIICIKKPSKFIFSFYGIIDFLSTIPTYLTLIFGGHNLFFGLRAFRLLRVFRILRMANYVKEGNRLLDSLRHSRAKILVFLFGVLIICIIMGTVMYLVEGPEAGFRNIPISIYWCIVTLTTVGYGDLAPITPLGQLISSIIMIVGYGIIAVPTGIVTAEYSWRKKVHLNTQVCPHCTERKHLDKAVFCHHCGNKLNE